MSKDAAPKADIVFDTMEEHNRQIDKAIAGFGLAVDAFLASVCERFTDILSKKAKGVDGVDYSGMECVNVGVHLGMNVVAVVHPAATRGLGDADRSKTVLYFKARSGGVDAEIEFLGNNGPWPVELFGSPIDPSRARIVSRRVSKEEVSHQLDRLLSEPSTLEYLVKSGVVSVAKSKSQQKEQISRRVMPDGWRVQEDLAWTVLRQEYGIADEYARPHWRPSLREVQNVEDEAASMMLYLMGVDDALKPTKLRGMGVRAADERIAFFQNMLGGVGKASRVSSSGGM